VQTPRNSCRARIALIVIGLTLVLVVSVLPIKATVAAASTQTTLRIGLLEPIDSLNPFIGINDNSYIFYGLVYDFLIAVNQSMKPKPDLAVSWNIVPDELPYGSVWQYNLTHEARWHDGEPFTADDVVFTLNLQSGDNWFKMWAYQPYTLMINYTEKIDDYTVRVHFFNRTSGQPAAVAFGDSLMLPIVPVHVFEGYTAENLSFSYTNPKPIGTGPFMCTDRTYEEFLRGERITLLRNPNYHLGPVKFDRLILEFYLEPAAMVTDMQRGAIDLAAFAAPNYKNLMDWLASNPTSAIGTYSGLTCTSYSVEIGICQADTAGTNVLRRDPAVRLAMALATDKEFIKDHIYMGYADTGYSLFSPIMGDWYWQPNATEENSYNLTKADQVLTAAGYTWNSDHTVRICSPSNPYKGDTNQLKFNVLVETELFEDRATVMFLEEEWAKIGIIINPVFVDSATWNNIVYNSGGAFDMEMTYWSGDPDPNYLLYTQSTDALSGWSENYYSNPEYDQNYTDSVLTTNHTQRLIDVHNCLEHIYEDNAFIVTEYPYGCWAWRTDHFTGWGDWGKYPGRQLSNFWSSNDLFFDLTPIATNQEPVAVLDNAGGHPGDAIQITGYAWDPEGDTMTYLMEFGDGDNTTGTVPSGGQLEFTHTYSAVGSYGMSLSVYDNTSGDISKSVASIVAVGTNVPPTNVRVIPNPMSGVVTGKEITFELSAKDPDGDPLTLSLDFGDSSAPFSSSASDTTQIFTESTQHKYQVAGDYELALNVSDGKNYTLVTQTLTVTKATSSNALLIAGALGVIVVVGVVAAVLIRKRGPARPKKEEEDIRLP
jgi:peptide/nickel transport system substrate-binding protein